MVEGLVLKLKLRADIEIIRWGIVITLKVVLEGIDCMGRRSVKLASSNPILFHLVPSE